MGEEETKEEEKKQAQAQEIVLKVDMHCEACARKVARALKGFQGVENVTTDCKASRVVVKGKDADPLKVCHRIQKKSGRKVELISPLPPPPPPPEEQNINASPPPPPQDPKKEEAPAVITVVLKVQMHCDACAQVLQKRIRKLKGVESVTADLANDEVVVKGMVEAEKLVRHVYKRTRKQASVVTKEEEEGDEEKKKLAEEEKKKEEEDAKNNKTEVIKKSEYLNGPQSQRNYMMMMEYYANYPPQMFSDENPHACSLM